MSTSNQTKLNIPTETEAVIYRANGRIEYVKPNNGYKFTVEELEEIVGGNIESMSLLRKFNIIFNEHGSLSPEIRPNLAFPQFCGDIVICKPNSW